MKTYKVKIIRHEEETVHYYNGRFIDYKWVKLPDPLEWEGEIVVESIKNLKTIHIEELEETFHIDSIIPTDSGGHILKCEPKLTKNKESLKNAKEQEEASIKEREKKKFIIKILDKLFS